MTELINIFWTGGLDSTYRMVQLSLLDVNVQPYYLFDDTLKSKNNELRAINKLLKLIRENKQTKANILDLIIVKEIAPDKDIYNAWEQLSDTYRLGTQYERIARFADQNNLNVELSLEKTPDGRASNAILGETKLKEYHSPCGINEFYIDVNNSSPQGVMIFRNMRMPMELFNTTKVEEINFLKSNGYEDVFLNTWFCHDPVLGMPCGHCNPCKDALNEGIAYRVPYIGRFLGRIRDVYRKIRKKIGLLRRKIF